MKRARVAYADAPKPGATFDELKAADHDTPQRNLLAKDDRHFSNGCVRLEDAQRLGRWFFGETPKAKSDAPEQHVPLPQPVPVYLTYLTAVPTKDGVTFLPDVYGRDGD